MEVVRVLLRKDGVKMAIIPKPSKIQAGEQIAITNNLDMITKILEEENKDGR